VSRNKQIKKSSYRQLFEFGLIAVAIIVMFFVVTSTMQITKGIAKEIVGPEYILRIEILNAGPEENIAEKLQDYLLDLDLKNMELHIVKTSQFSIQHSKETFIIRRTDNEKSVIELAKLLNINEKKIQYSKLRNNKNHLSATIVIGSDLIINNLLEQPKEFE